jgi:hypothetical protein
MGDGPNDWAASGTAKAAEHKAHRREFRIVMLVVGSKPWRDKTTSNAEQQLRRWSGQ